MTKKENVPVPVIIQKVLKESKEPLSTYEIAKKAGISWSTTNIHCYKLKDDDIIGSKLEVAAIGSGKKMLWFLK